MNIVIFQGEDTGRHQHCYGDPFGRTPHIDRLAATGCRFTNAFSTAPVCSPSRSTHITGRYPSAIGTHHHRSKLIDPPTLYTEVLREAGYYVNWANKTDFNFEPTESFADEQTDWIEAMEGGWRPRAPFLLYYNFPGTHESQAWPRESKPGVEPPAPEPGHGDDRNAGVPVPPYLPDVPETRAALMRYYDRLIEQDAMVGRAMAALDQHGLAQDTIVIYFSDHGRGLLREKRWLYEAGIHMPLIVRWPGMIAPGSVREDLVSWIDLAPTLLQLAGIDRSHYREHLKMPGRVFIGPDAEPEPDHVFACRDRMDEMYDRIRAVRDRRYLYIRNDFPQIPWAQRNQYMETSPLVRRVRRMHAAGELTFPVADLFAARKPDEELYDTRADPDCLFDLADRPDMADRLDWFRATLERWREQHDQLGQCPERALVERGLTEDQTDFLAERVAPLPNDLSHGGLYDTTTAMPEA